MNRIRRYFVEDEDYSTMTRIEKEAYCYRLLVERDKIDERLRQVQESMRSE